jgi:hypothetical protein
MDIPTFDDFKRRFRDPVWIDIASEICHRESIRFNMLSRAEQGENILSCVRLSR